MRVLRAVPNNPAGLHSQPSHEGERMRPGSRETWIEHVVILRALRGAGPAVHSRRRLQVRALGARNLRAGIEAPEPAPGRHYMEKSAGAQVCSHLAARAVPLRSPRARRLARAPPHPRKGTLAGARLDRLRAASSAFPDSVLYRPFY